MIFVYIAIGYIAFCSLFLLFNLYYLWKAIRLFKTYKKYVKNCINGVIDSSITEKTIEIRSLFKMAGIKDSYVYYTKPLGYWQIANTSLSVYANIANVTHAEISGLVTQMFKMTIGVFKHRCMNSFNPIWWISNIFALPSIILEYIGFENKTWGRLANVVIWCITVATFIITNFAALKALLGL